MKNVMKFKKGDVFVFTETNEIEQLISVNIRLRALEYDTPENMYSGVILPCSLVFDGEKFVKEGVCLDKLLDVELFCSISEEIHQEKLKAMQGENQWDVMTNANHIKESKLLDGLSEEIKNQAAILWVKVYGFEITQVCHASATNQADMALETFVNRFKS